MLINLKEIGNAIINKVEIMDKSVHELTLINTAIEATVQTRHEGQLMMDNNIKILMIKLGIKTGPVNKKATQINETKGTASAPGAKEISTWIQVEDDGEKRLDNGTDRGIDGASGPSYKYSDADYINGAEECHTLTGVVSEDMLLQ